MDSIGTTLAASGRGIIRLGTAAKHLIMLCSSLVVRVWKDSGSDCLATDNYFDRSS